MVHTSLVAAHSMLNSLVRGKVNSMRRSSSNNNARHATPQAEETLAGSYLVRAAQDSSGLRRCARVENLHSSLPWPSAIRIRG